MDDREPELPSAYQFSHIDKVECLRQHTIGLAANGAEEGTIILVDALTNAKGSRGKVWSGVAGNLHAAVILQPDFPKSRYHEILFVATVSLGNAIAAEVAPMTALSFGWPNDIYIAGYKVASIWLDYGMEENAPWLVVTCSTNIRHDACDSAISSISIFESEGVCTLTPVDLMEGWARQFITLINEWSEKGFKHILNLWRIRAEFQKTWPEVFDEKEILQDKNTVDYQQSIDKHGDLLLVDGDSKVATINLHSWLKEHLSS